MTNNTDPVRVEQCPKCNRWSGDDWKQCEGACPMPQSPHHVAQQPAPPSAPVEVERLRRMVEKLAAHVRPTCGELWNEAQAALSQQTAASSTPVRVDDALVAGAMEAAADACTRHVVCNEAITAAVEYALAQQQQQGGRADG